MAVSPAFLAKMPKVELHVHLEGSIRPETVLALARKHNIELPAQDLEGLTRWYAFRNFAHFVDVYVAVSKCIRDVDDVEFIAREFLQGQASQNIIYTEATYTACTIERHCGIPVAEQIEALNRAIAWGRNELGVDLQLVLDIVRGDTVERAMEVVGWVAEWLGNGVCALGIAGFESRGTLAYAPAFEEARRLGIPVTAHAGETEGAWSIAETLDVTGATRIGHGVRAVEDAGVLRRLVSEGIVLEVCPTSNLCLGVASSLVDHPLPKLMDAGVKVTLNSDDPPMFGTTLTQEWIRCADAWGWDLEAVRKLSLEAIAAAFLPEARKAALRERTLA